MTIEGKLLAGILAYQQGPSLPKDFGQALTLEFRDCLILGRKAGWPTRVQELEAVVDTIANKLPEFRREKIKALLADAKTETPAPGDLVREDYLAGKVNTLLSGYLGGEDVSLEEGLHSILDSLPVVGNGDYDNLTGLDNLLALKDDTAAGGGIPWGYPWVNRYLYPAAPGHQVILAGEPGTGKTSSCMALVAGMVGHESHPLHVLWLNNEGPTYEIRLRAYNALLKATNSELRGMGIPEAEEAFQKALAGSQMDIRGIHGLKWGQVKTMIEQVKPDMVVIDMLDHLVNATGDRPDLALEYLYKGFREHAAAHGYIGIGTSQLSDIDPRITDPKNPGLRSMKGSRVGKQGAAQEVWIMGRDHQYPRYRYFTMPKTKIPREGVDMSAMIVVDFDRDRCQMTEVQMAAAPDAELEDYL